MGDDINGLRYQDWFGFSLSLSGDGKILLVGSDGYDNTDDDKGNTGALYVFYYSDNYWNRLALEPGDNVDDYFGQDAVISKNGKVLAVGAIEGDDDNGNEVGYVKIYKIVDGKLVLGAKLYGSQGSYFGQSITLSSDGKIIAIGAPKAVVMQEINLEKL